MGLSWGSSVHRPGSEDPHRFNNINWKKVSKIRWNGEIIKMYFSILHSAPFNFQPYSRGWNTWKNHFWFWNIITTRNRNITTWNRICLIDSSFSCLQMPRTQISCPFQINLAKNNIFKAFLAFGPFLLDRDPRARTQAEGTSKIAFIVKITLISFQFWKTHITRLRQVAQSVTVISAMTCVTFEDRSSMYRYMYKCIHIAIKPRCLGLNYECTRFN